MRDETFHDNTRDGEIAKRDYADLVADEARPFHPHECTRCYYLGCRLGGWRPRYDLFLCDWPGGPDLIARFGPEPKDWVSASLKDYAPGCAAAYHYGPALDRAAELASHAVNTAELEETRRLILDDPALLDMNALGRCLVGLTLSRVVGRQVGIEDKRQIPSMALTHLGLDGAHLDLLYRIGAWPDDLRERWHAIPARRDWERHPLGHLADDDAERRERAVIAATVVERFIASLGNPTVTVHKPLQLIDHTKPEADEDIEVQPGVYTLARIPNPYGYDGKWLVIEGTTVGMTEISWHSRARSKSRSFDLAYAGEA